MREALADTVELPETEGHVLQALVQAMYQKPFTVSPGVLLPLLPLFVAADAYQVLTQLYVQAVVKGCTDCPVQVQAISRPCQAHLC